MRMSLTMILTGIVMYAAGAERASNAGARPTPSASASADTIASDEVVVLFPTVATMSDDGTVWRVPVHAWLFEPEEDSDTRSVVLKVLAEALDLDDDAADSPLFRERGRSFLVDNERGKSLQIEIAGVAHVLPATGADGHSEAVIDVPTDRVNAWLSAEKRTDRSLTMTITAGKVSVDTPARVFRGEAILAPSDGLSVISDIDDTIKVSEVSDRERLLARTFLEPFTAVKGMSSVYAVWSARGAVFHYVSSSPWQLGPPLMSWMDADGFPRGAMHLKRFRWKDSSYSALFASPEVTKPPVLEAILKAHPGRQFILVGDSGERDPEIYARLARDYPKQILRICIRNTTDEGAAHARWAATFAELPSDLWRIFDDPATLLDIEPKQALVPAPPAPHVTPR